MIRRLSTIAFATAVFLGATILLANLSTPALASTQIHEVDPDGRVTFYASTTSVTRISIKDGRIRRIINDQTLFEMTNDETTGDVFFRFTGETAKKETGFLVSENGETISYTLIPTDKAVPPVILHINSKNETAQNAGSLGEISGYGDDVASALTQVIRNVVNAHVIGHEPKGRGNKVYKSITDGAWKATIVIASGGKHGRLLNEQEFGRPGVRAVWIQNTALGANEKTFVVVVEAN
jgi:hypothetical protein